MNNNKKILVFPGAFQVANKYGDYEGVDIWLKANSEQEIPAGDYLIGHSLGASFALAHYNSNQNCKFILINPLVKKRSALIFWRWLKFIIFERIKTEKIIPKSDWLYAFKKAIKLLNVDILNVIQKIPKENLIIIRGKQDIFFCDSEAVKVIQENNIALVEVEAGHDWNDKIANTVKEIIK